MRIELSLRADSNQDLTTPKSAYHRDFCSFDRVFDLKLGCRFGSPGLIFGIQLSNEHQQPE